MMHQEQKMTFRSPRTSLSNLVGRTKLTACLPQTDFSSLLLLMSLQQTPNPATTCQSSQLPVPSVSPSTAHNQQSEPLIRWATHQRPLITYFNGPCSPYKSRVPTALPPLRIQFRLLPLLPFLLSTFQICCV